MISGAQGQRHDRRRGQTAGRSTPARATTTCRRRGRRHAPRRPGQRRSQQRRRGKPVDAPATTRLPLATATTSSVSPGADKANTAATATTDGRTAADGQVDTLDCGPGNDVAFENAAEHDTFVNCERVAAAPSRPRRPRRTISEPHSHLPPTLGSDRACPATAGLAVLESGQRPSGGSTGSCRGVWLERNAAAPSARRADSPRREDRDGRPGARLRGRR